MSRLAPLKKAATHFYCSTSLFYRLKDRMEIDFHYLGGKVYVDLDEVEAKIKKTTSKKQKV